MTEKVLYSSRQWLNPKDSCDSGMISSSVEIWDGLGHSTIDADFSIWDCSRKVSLNFSYDDEKQAQAVGKKINLIIDEMIKFKDALGKGYPMLQEREWEEEG